MECTIAIKSAKGQKCTHTHSHTYISGKLCQVILLGIVLTQKEPHTHSHTYISGKLCQVILLGIVLTQKEPCLK